MPREVDDRVVRMQFDNAQFERETKRSLNTIDRLKSSLNFDRASDSLNGLSTAASKLDLSPVSDGVDTISMRFRTLDIVAATVISNITNKVVGLGKQMISAFAIDPIKTGLAEYETQIGAVQTILANTQSRGTTLDQVNAALDELNHYADMTIYNFTEMTKNIGTFTAAGVDLDTSVQAIKGIANLAAVSGSTSQQASTAMYQLSQALAAGRVTLMDWNSVVNAGMGGQVFQDALIETARVSGVAIDDMIAKQGSFRDTLQEGWLTSEIMLDTLAKFTGDLNREQLLAKGYTEEQADAIVKLGANANDAATKVKTFTQLIDTLKEAVQSGWTQSWEYIFGDFEQAKAFWTEISDAISNVVNESANARNALLQGAMTSGWDQLLSQGITDSASVMEQVLIDIGKTSGKVTDEQIKAAGGFEKSLQSGWMTADILQKGINEVVDQAQELLSLSDEQLSAQGLSRDAIEETLKSYQGLNEEIAKGSVNLRTLSERMSMKSTGRDNLVQSVRNTMSAIGTLVGSIKTAFDDIFPPTTVDQLYAFTEGIERFTRGLILSEENADKVQRVFKGVFSVFKIGTDILETLYKGFLNVAKTISPVGNSLLDLAASVGDFLVGIEQAVDSSGIFQGILSALEWVCDAASKGIDKFTSSLDSLSQKTTIVLNPLEAIGSALTSFVNFIAPGLIWFGTVASEALGEFSKSAYEAFNNFDPTNLYNFMNAGMIAGILSGIYNFVDNIGDILDATQGVVANVKKVFSKTANSIQAFTNNIQAETLIKIAKAIAILAASLVVLSLVKPERLTGAIVAISTLFLELSVAFGALSTLTTGKQIQTGVMSTALVAMSAGILILSAALKTISSVDPERLVASMMVLTVTLAELTTVTVLMSKTTNRMTKGTTGMILMATAVRILASSVSALGSMSLEGLAKGVISLGLVMTELGAFAILMSKFDGSVGLLNGISFNLLASSLLILQKAVSSFGAMDLSDIAKGLGAVGIALAGFAGFGFLSSFSKNLISGSVAVTVMSAAMNLLVDPMKELGALDLETLAKALGAMAIALTEFVVALNLMNGGLASSASILVMAAAMNVLADAFARMGELSIGSLAKSLISIALALATFGVAATLLAPVTPIIVALSLSLGAFAAALGLLLVAASSAQLISNLAGSLALLANINFSAFLQGIKNVAWMFVEFLQGIVKGVGEIASTLVTSIAQIITAVCDAIVMAAPAIGSAITSLIITLCQVIRDSAPEIAYTVVYLIGQVWEAIKGALNDLWNNFTAWFDENIWHHDWFGIGDMFNDFKAIWAGDAEEAGAETAEGYANGLESKKQSIFDKMSEIASKSALTWNRFWGIESPSKLAADNADYVVQGYAEGLQNGEGTLASAILNIAQAANDAFRDFWGINSPSDLAASDAENIAIGMQLGMVNSAQATQNVARYLATHTAEGLATSDASKSAYAAGITLGIDYEQGVKDSIGGSELLNWLKGKTGIGENTSTDAPQTTPTVKSSSGGSTKKTVAETVEEKYEDQLEANKTLQEIAESEYQLWLTENQNSVSTDELLARKMEYTAKEIENQTARVQLAQQKYDEMVSKVGVDKQETKKAYADLLSEQTTLAELRANQYANLYEDQINRLEIQNDRADKEYQLWVDQNSQASASEKTAKKIEYQTTQLTAATKELKLAQQQYDKLREEYGESDLRTQEAYNDLLDKQIEEQEKTNELWQARLAQFDDALNAIEMQSNLYSQRTNMLSQIYDDGDLSTRSDDYINAVKTYGKNSDEALKARYQGSASAVLGVSTALRSMADQLSRTNVYQKYYNELVESGTASAEELNAAEQQLLSSQSAFISYASDLADAFNMSDEGKAITLRLAYAISDNWDTVYGAFESVWKKIEDRAPQLTANLEKVFGELLSEDTASVATGLVSTVTSALSGDYGGALASGLNTILSFMGSSAGQSLIDAIGTALAGGLPDIAGMITQLVGGSGLLSNLIGGLEGIIGAIGGGAGLTGVVEMLGTALAGIGAALPELLPIIAIVAAIGAAIAFLVSNWDDIGEFFNNLWEKVKEIGSNLVNGIVEGIKSAWQGLVDFVSGLFGGLIDFVKGIFGINSHSKKFFEMGSYIDQGFANGLASGADSVNKSIEDMSNSALTTATKVSEMLYDALSNDTGFQPTITPVIDLTDAEESANWFKSASVNYTNPFQNTPVRSRQLATETAVREIQNGKSDKDSSRSDVVAAIDALSNRVVMMGQSIESMQIVLDSKKLVGGISGQMDSALGVRAGRARRGG